MKVKGGIFYPGVSTQSIHPYPGTVVRCLIAPCILNNRLINALPDKLGH